MFTVPASLFRCHIRRKWPHHIWMKTKGPSSSSASCKKFHKEKICSFWSCRRFSDVCFSGVHLRDRRRFRRTVWTSAARLGKISGQLGSRRPSFISCSFSSSEGKVVVTNGFHCHQRRQEIPPAASSISHEDKMAAQLRCCADGSPRFIQGFGACMTSDPHWWKRLKFPLVQIPFIILLINARGQGSNNFWMFLFGAATFSSICQSFGEIMKLWTAIAGSL